MIRRIKFVLALVLCVVYMQSIAQELPQIDGKVVYSLDVYNDGYDKGRMFEECQNFLTNVIKRENVVIQMEDLDRGQLIGKAVSAFSNVASKGFTWTIGVVTRPTFTMQFDVYDNKATLTIKEIVLAKLNVDDEILRPIEYDMTLEKRKIQTLKGKAYEKRLKKYQKNADMINDHFYSLLILFKRSIENSKANR